MPVIAPRTYVIDSNTATMIDIDIPGFRRLTLDLLVCDYNGTLARDGRLLDEVRARIAQIARKLRVQIVTGDTFGTAREELRGLPADVVILPADGQAEAKLELIKRHGARTVAAVGNGRNDRLMLAEAALGIGVIGDEGIATEALVASDVTVRHITDAFDLLIKQQRLIASLRA
jgi:P-type E1-E2 ATPase